MNLDSNWKARTLLVGGLLGALTGLGAAYLLVQRAEREGAEPSVSAGEGVRLGLLLLGLLRSIAELPDREKD